MLVAAAVGGADVQRQRQAVGEALKEHGYKLRLDKTKAHCPRAACDDALAAELREELDGFAELAQRSLPLLGKAADGEHFTILTARGPLAGPTEKRMAGARELAQRLHALLDADLAGRKLGPAWKLTSQVLNKALSYDVCVSSPDRLRPHTDELDDIVAGIARRCVDPGRVDADAEWQRALELLR